MYDDSSRSLMATHAKDTAVFDPRKGYRLPLSKKFGLVTSHPVVRILTLSNIQTVTLPWTTEKVDLCLE